LQSLAIAGALLDIRGKEIGTISVGEDALARGGINAPQRLGHGFFGSVIRLNAIVGLALSRRVGVIDIKREAIEIIGAVDAASFIDIFLIFR
jgi:hypothetical protein